MTTEEKIFELLKYCNNEAVRLDGEAKEHGEEWSRLAEIVAVRRDQLIAVIKYWESLNKEK